MSGFSGDSAWGATAGRRRRRHVVEPVEPAVPDDRVRYTATVALARQSATDAATVAGAREVLTATVEAYARLRGLLVVQGLFHTDPPEDTTATVLMRLEAELIPRIDGEWPAIHAAIREDEADRAAALAAKATVGDRLDALATAAAYWSARSAPELREALRSPIPQATDTV